jgi:hypothetical protein
MFQAFRNIWEAIATLAYMLNRTANAGDHIARYAEISAKNWADQALADQKTLGNTDGEEPSPTTTTGKTTDDQVPA